MEISTRIIETETYLLKSKLDAFSSLQTFVQSVVIVICFHIDHFGAGTGGDFIGKDLQDYTVFKKGCRSSTPAPAHHRESIYMLERVGRIVASMVRCMLADIDPSKFLWRALMFAAAFLGNSAPPSAIDMQSPYNMVRRTEPDLSLLRVIGARAIRHIERHSKKLDLTEGVAWGYHMMVRGVKKASAGGRSL